MGHGESIGQHRAHGEHTQGDAVLYQRLYQIREARGQDSLWFACMGSMHLAYCLSMPASVRYGASMRLGGYLISFTDYRRVLGHPVTITTKRRNAPQWLL